MAEDEITLENMLWADKSDLQVAHHVRGLMRSDLDHELVCVAGRDRIMYLSQQLEKEKIWGRFASYLLDLCEGETITEENLQLWLARMLKPETREPAQKEGDSE